jgi:hypothetical protein
MTRQGDPAQGMLLFVFTNCYGTFPTAVHVRVACEMRSHPWQR